MLPEDCYRRQASSHVMNVHPPIQAHASDGSGYCPTGHCRSEPDGRGQDDSPVTLQDPVQASSTASGIPLLRAERAICEDPAHSVFAGDGVSGHLIQGSPARFEPAHTAPEGTPVRDVYTGHELVAGQFAITRPWIVHEPPSESIRGSMEVSQERVGHSAGSLPRSKRWPSVWRRGMPAVSGAATQAVLSTPGYLLLRCPPDLTPSSHWRCE